ncbi:RNA polymerase I [Tieghemostelium lacteum]|uniref:DNA-directed RNA polymerase subunit n=1 Tax=Tieghemostelium lacteum TaxID=361077 RepID=A0A152A7L3_TIELA|nr:RNA polymerase I [Tieghemostelium lacteum]|eukprot:KYR02194.1 RNA polymerase I [Tieghemostelium lacteum]
MATNIIKNEVSNVSFQFYTSNDIRKLSVKQIIETEAFDSLGSSILGGLHDPSLGPIGPPEICYTCGLDYIECPGHFGHIELALPCYNPVTFQVLLKLLKSKCFNCNFFKHGKVQIEHYIKLLKLLYSGEIVAAKILDEDYKNTLKKGTNKELEELLKKDEEDEDEKDDDSENDGEDHIDNPSMIPINLLKQIDEQGGIQTGQEKVVHFEDLRRQILREFLGIAGSHTTACANCQGYSPRIRNGDASRSKLFIMPLTDTYAKKNSHRKYKVNFSSVDEQTIHGTWFAPWEMLEQIKDLFYNEKEILDLLFGHTVTDQSDKKGLLKKESTVESFFMEVFPVTPSRYRPPNYMNGRRGEHPQNSHFKGMLKCNKLIKQSIESGEGKAKFLVNAVCELQLHVNNMYDNSKSSTPMNQVANGIKQILEKKEGLFRKHMMGKRVNYAARTVISPDISLESNEMGVPQYFAKTLTFPQPVTSFNYQQMAQAVINGPDVYPGANFIEDENGYLTNLSKESLEKRIALSKTLLTSHPHAPRGTNKKVYRHLLNGDFVLANRQPTLHKPGIMGHRVKVLGKDEKTLRMHYCNCSTYNADFDGDEMNIHFPQSLLAASEIREIAANNYQYLGPRNGGPLRGLIQDHILTGVLLTKKDTLFSKSEFAAILYASLWAVNTKHPIQMPHPCIVKPVPMWSGKQLITAALNHITIGRIPMNLEAPSKIPVKMWGTYGPEILRDSTVIIRQNEMLAGILDKGHFGASSFGLVHTCYELYDPDVAGTLLTTLGRMFTNYLSKRGFTCGVDDILMKSKEEQFRLESLKKANEEGYQVAAKFADLKTYNYEDAKKHMAKALQSEREVAKLDGMLKKALNTYTSKIIDTLIPGGQMKPFPKNNFSLMTVSGAKGSVVNFSQVSCLLGQQELEGKRVPRMVSGKTLPSYQPYDASARAGGFVMDRFLTGVRPQDYFFHCMAGREGLIDTAVKTSRSGYLQRCLIKHLEGLTVQYDNTVRDSDGSVIQFYYGEDALEIGKTPFLDKYSLIAQNYSLVKSQFNFDELVHSLKNVDLVEYADQMRNATPEELEMDPIMSRFNPSCDLGCTSESFMNSLQKYIDSNPQGLIKNGKNPKGTISEFDFKNLMHLYYNRSMISPGDSVGLVCAQSIGEPSTQMTLNTFHLAGRGEANVTLGIPRLREIIMTASVTPTTPLMEFQLNDPTNREETEKLAKYLEMLKMSDLIQDITVNEYTDENGRNYDVEIQFISTIKEVLTLHKLQESQLSTLLEGFIKQVNSVVNRTNGVKTQSIGSGSKVGSDRDEVSNMDTDEETPMDNAISLDFEGETNGTKSNTGKASSEPSLDDDSLTSKKKSKKNQKGSYDDEEDSNSNKNKKKKKSDKSDDDMDDDESEIENKTTQNSSNDSGDDNEDNEDKMDVDSGDDDDTTISSSIQSKNFKFSLKHFKFTTRVPTDCKKILMLGIVETVSQKFIIKSCKGISRCFVNEKTVKGQTEYSIQTEGINLRELFQLKDRLRINQLYTNDIASILRKYGVEACNRAIVSEISGVFGAYGISVDKRHLSLLADYMTFEGGYRALNRVGIENNTSPFQKMSFETTFAFLTKSALVADQDSVVSPSSRIVLGQIVRSGTGAFEIIAPIN